MTTIPFLPESAPFTPSQRAWLNGFFAGLLGGGAPAAGGAASVPVPVPPASPPQAEPWHDPNLQLPERLALAEGRPLNDRLMATLAQLDCHACGYDCRTYAAAMASGAEKKLVLCSPGGAPTAAKLKELLAAPASPASTPSATAAPSAKPAPKPGAATPRSGKITFPARLLAREILHHPGATAPVVHLVLDAAEASESFQPGDSFGVFPENSVEAVEAALATLGASGRERVVSPAKRSVSLRAALAEDCDLRDLDEVLKSFEPKRPSVGDVAGSLGRLKPRLYTLASSPRLHPGEAHLVVGVTPNGLASTWLAQRLPVGGAVRVFVNPGRVRLPARGDAPIIMIGSGTGMALFRSFLQERKATAAGGWSWLFFGGATEADDLCREEVERFLADGVLTRLDKAFPGDGTPGVTLAERIGQNGEELWRWIAQGAHVYVSGDLRRMAPEVDAALRRLAAEHGGRTDGDAKAFWDGLVKEKRYQREIY